MPAATTHRRDGHLVRRRHASLNVRRGNRRQRGDDDDVTMGRDDLRRGGDGCGGGNIRSCSFTTASSSATVMATNRRSSSSIRRSSSEHRGADPPISNYEPLDPPATEGGNAVAYSGTWNKSIYTPALLVDSSDIMGASSSDISAEKSFSTTSSAGAAPPLNDGSIPVTWKKSIYTPTILAYPSCGTVGPSIEKSNTASTHRTTSSSSSSSSSRTPSFHSHSTSTTESIVRRRRRQVAWDGRSKYYNRNKIVSFTEDKPDVRGRRGGLQSTKLDNRRARAVVPKKKGQTPSSINNRTLTDKNKIDNDVMKLISFLTKKLLIPCMMLPVIIIRASTCKKKKDNECMPPSLDSSSSSSVDDEDDDSWTNESSSSSSSYDDSSCDNGRLITSYYHYSTTTLDEDGEEELERCKQDGKDCRDLIIRKRHGVVLVGKEKRDDENVQSYYRDCIEDLICENKSLYHKIVTLSQDREEILQKLCNGNDTVNNEKSSTRCGGYNYYFLNLLKKEGEGKDNLLLEKARIRRMKKYDGNQNLNKEDLHVNHQESSIRDDDYLLSGNKSLRSKIDILSREREEDLSPNKCIVILDESIAKLIETENAAAKLLSSSSLNCNNTVDDETGAGHEEDSVTTMSKKIIKLVSNESIAKLIETENAAAKLLSSSSLNCNNTVDDETGAGHEEDSVTTMAKEIIKLVSKIVDQRVHRVNVPADPSTDNKVDRVKSDHDKKSSSCPPHVSMEDESKNPSDGAANDSSIRLKSERLDHEDLEKSFSVSSIMYHQPYVFNDSMNSLFDGERPTSVKDYYEGEIDGNYDDEAFSNLKLVVYEHCRDSGVTRTPLTHSRKTRTAHSHAHDGDNNFNVYDGERVSEECYLDEDGQVLAEEEYYSDEDVYQRFSPISSTYSRSQYSSSSRKSNMKRNKSYYSHCSSFAPSSTKERAIDAAVEVNKEQSSNIKDIDTDDAKSIGMTQEPRLQPEIVDNGDDDLPSPSRLYQPATSSIQSPGREVNLQRARDLLRCSGGPADVNSTTNDSLTEEDDMTHHPNKCIVLQDSIIVELIETEDAINKPVSSSSSNCNAKVNAEQGSGHDADSKSRSTTRYSNFDDSASSSSGNSTKEYKAICISVISRSSRYISFPSSWAHTYGTFFRATMLMSQVVAVLEEQLRVTRAGLDLLKDQKSGNRKSKKYQGEYNQEGKKHGYGLYTSKNGNEYLGEWQNDRREGLGIVKIGNGDIFEGQFENNLKCGIGVYHYRDGECDLSLYKDDARIGDSIRFSKDRTQAFLILCISSCAKALSLEKAAQVAKEMGILVAFK